MIIHNVITNINNRLYVENFHKIEDAKKYFFDMFSVCGDMATYDMNGNSVDDAFAQGKALFSGCSIRYLNKELL